MKCSVCDQDMGAPIYQSLSDSVLTSLCELRKGRKRVWSCSSCAHLCGEELPDTAQYYANDYRILLDQDDEDQIYEVRGEQIVYRTRHQVDTLLTKIALPQGALLLDYGCAKASTPKQLLEQRPDLQVHLFDVSEMYTKHWDRFANAEKRAIHSTPAHWQRRFDVVTSFFALEHIPAPKDTVEKIAALLNDDGVFYGIVPDTFGNVADFVVIDHVNHFTTPSLHTLLRTAGFSHIEIDATAHRGALVFVARKGGTLTVRDDVAETRSKSLALAGYWNNLSGRIRSAERQHSKAPAAIYGSGFYGAYIASALADPNGILCFLDRSPYQQGKQLFGHPILAPEQLPDSVRVLYVGLNPVIARDTVQKMNWIRERNLSVVFLDEGAE